MVKTRQTSIALYLMALALCVSFSEASENARNGEIVIEYQTMAKQLQEVVIFGLSSENAFVPWGKTHRAVKLAGYLRCKVMRDILLADLGYTPWCAFQQNDNVSFTNFNFFAGITGERLLLEGRYPAVAALLHIGVPFSEFLPNISRYGGFESGEALSIIGLSCGGIYYFWHVLQTDDEWKFFPLSNRLPPYDLPIGFMEISTYGGIEIDGDFIDFVKKYDTMQETLISRFTEELASSSANIADTIHTMGFIRSLKAIPILTENLTVCPQVSTNAPGGYLFPAAEALIEIGPAIGYCFNQLEEAKPLSVEESLWLRISHELYPEGLEYDLMRRAETNDTRAVRLLDALPWRRLDSNYEIVGKPDKHMDSKHENE